MWLDEFGELPAVVFKFIWSPDISVRSGCSVAQRRHAVTQHRRGRGKPGRENRGRKLGLSETGLCNDSLSEKHNVGRAASPSVGAASLRGDGKLQGERTLVASILSLVSKKCDLKGRRIKEDKLFLTTVNKGKL